MRLTGKGTLSVAPNRLLVARNHPIEEPRTSGPSTNERKRPVGGSAEDAAPAQPTASQALRSPEP